MALFYFILPIVFFALIIIAPYYIILGGLRLLRIGGISKSKVFVFYLLLIITAFLINKTFTLFLLNNLKIRSNSIIYWLINNAIYLVVNFLLLRYYFHLSGKKLWQFFLYLVVIGLIFSVLISLLLLIK